jgi:hypothetical protein
MLKDLHLTDGIGTKAARNILAKSSKGVQQDRTLTSATNANT